MAEKREDEPGTVTVVDAPDGPHVSVQGAKFGEKVAPEK